MLHLIGLVLALTDPPAAPAAGPAATCLIVGRQLEYKVVDEGALAIRAGGRWHRSRLPDGCPGLVPNRIVVRREASPRLCANDLFEVKDNFTPEVFSLCRFGPFEPLAKGTRF
ncbi:hypothetical protein [Sandarakinorhabdus rubra]|uniref:hypothetical protein n=1 Tax=Sandarakinorhabdus rubra TaxID=2672568 RepID=UPI0013DB9D6B|nr:hypothetical protein [Sandarakinorhabdus rubra]